MSASRTGADMMDTKIGTSEKDDAAMVARSGIRGNDAPRRRCRHRTQGQAAVTAANVMPAGVLARQHRQQAEPGSAKQ